VIYTVSLQTLLRRRIPAHLFSQPSTQDVRCDVAEDFRLRGTWGTGVKLGSFAQIFRARAPLQWIPHQLFYDCVWIKIVGDDVIVLRYADEEVTRYEDFDFWHLLEDGIDTSLYDWWLTAGNFLLDDDEFDEWRNVVEDNILDDLTEFWETWHDIGPFGEGVFIMWYCQEEIIDPP
jgi:hypothetical protein